MIRTKATLELDYTKREPFSGLLADADDRGKNRKLDGHYFVHVHFASGKACIRMFQLVMFKRSGRFSWAELPR